MQNFARQMREIGRKQSRMMRDQTQVSAMKRKEEYLGARVPKDLRQKVIAKADSLGIPVSILIRNILEDAFNVHVAHGREQEARTASTPGSLKAKFPNIIGWENITLNRDVACSGCLRHLPAGSSAIFGLGMPREDHVILCEKCREYA
ncbi:MAG: hypothetical protein IPK65_11365 [Gammaproteobacteria bacterium]|nr:hypothetical protein [Gammaproteobacteria bacterium]